MRSRTLGLGLLTVLLTLLAPRAALAQEASPSREGIAVHGQWTVTVVRDGSVVERREFENALTAGGRGHLFQLLTRQGSAGPWMILVEADGSGTLCANNEFVLGTDTDCAIAEASAEMTVGADPTISNAILLNGTETVVRDANITLVNTLQYRCSADVAPVNCPAPSVQQPDQFTRKSLATPIAVQTGDRIQVSVVLSFN